MRESKAFVAMLMSFVPTLRCLLPSMLKGLRPLFLYLLVAVMSLKLWLNIYISLSIHEVRDIRMCLFRTKPRKSFCFGDNLSQVTYMMYMQPPAVHACWLGPNWGFVFPPAAFMMCYVHPSVVQAFCLGQNLMIHVPPWWLTWSDICTPGGVGMLVRPEVMFLMPPGSVHDVLYVPRGLHNVIGTPGGVDLTMYFTVHLH